VPGAEQEDLIQEGMLGLARALNGYSPDRDASFNTYASVCIKNSLISAIRRLSGDKRLNVLYIEDVGELGGGFEVEQILSGTGYQGSYLEDIVSLLSDFEKEVLMLYMSGMNRTEMSLKTKKSYKSIDNALVRIKNKARNSNTRRQ
jgi:RNA polymerase sporulation-specific sigma factor